MRRFLFILAWLAPALAGAQSLTLAPGGPHVLAVGDTVRETTVALDAKGKRLGNARPTWRLTTAGPATLRVDGSTKGATLRAVAPGTTAVVATWASGGRVVADTVRVTVRGAVPPPTPATVALAVDGGCLDAAGRLPGDTTPLARAACVAGRAPQQWRAPAVGVAGPVRLASDTGRCADVWRAAGTPGSAVVLWPCHGGANQQWTRTSPGALTGLAGLCARAHPADSARVVLGRCTGPALDVAVVTPPPAVPPVAPPVAPPVVIAPPTPIPPVVVPPAVVLPPPDVGTPTPPPVVVAPTPTTADTSVAELPRVVPETRYPATTGKTISVAAGGDLQAALNAARGGDVVGLAPGATWTGNYVLPNRGAADTGVVVVRTAPSVALPPEGTRITPATAVGLARIQTPNNGPALSTMPGTRGWRLTGLELGVKPGAGMGYTIYEVLRFGSTGDEQRTLAQVPSRLVLDRSVVRGNDSATVRRCLLLNSAWSAVTDSHLDDCHEKGADSQAIVGWNGPGPYLIQNNHLAGAGENVMFGGADPEVPGVVPSDITIRGNYLYKPLTWRGRWTAKNLFELKLGRRVLVEGNTMENSWGDAQVGPLAILRSSHQDACPSWCRTEDLTIRGNRFVRVGSGWQLIGDNAPVPLRRVLIADNVITQFGALDGARRPYQLTGVGERIVIDHNTVDGSDNALLLYVEGVGPGFRFTHNVAPAGQYGVFTSGGGAAVAGVLDVGVGPGRWTFAGNALVGAGRPDLYPAGNLFPGSLSAAAALRSADGRPAGADPARVPAGP